MFKVNKKPSKKERDTRANVKAALNQEGDTTPLALFKAGQMLDLNIEQVRCYEKNPRIAQGDKYTDIYDSIRAKGLNGTLTVSQRPEDDLQSFVLVDGGNTRLSILKRLYEETGDNKYFQFKGVYEPWKSDSHAIINHLIENDARSDYIFIDRALGVRQVKIELETETESYVTDKDLLSILKEEGYTKVNKPTLSLMNYAVDRLHPICPILLETGVGPGHVIDLKKLDKKAGILFLEKNLDKIYSDWAKLFNLSLSKLESECVNDDHFVYSYDNLYSDVVTRLANNDKREQNLLEFILEERLNKNNDKSYLSHVEESKQPEHKPQTTHSDSLIEPDADPVPKENTSNNALLNDGDIDPDHSVIESSPEDPITPNSNSDGIQISSNELEAASEISNSTVSPNGVIVHHEASEHQTGRYWSEDSKDHETSVFSDVPISCHDVMEVAPLPDTVPELRQIMFDKAFYFSTYMEIGQKIVAPINSGAGFVLTRMPNKEGMERISHNYEKDKNPRTNLFHKHYIGWWLLLSFSDMLQQNHLRNFDVIEKYQVKGDLQDSLMRPFDDYTTPLIWDFDAGIHHALCADLVPLFISHATPKQLQLFIELSLTSNRLFAAAENDIWSTTGRGVK